MDRVYRFDPHATPVGPAPVLEDGPTPTPAPDKSYQYYAIPLTEGTAQEQGTPTPCAIKWPEKSTGVLYPTPATVTPNATEIFHAGYSGIPQLEAEVAYTGGRQGTWDTYEAEVTDSEWVTKPGFAWGSEDDDWSLLALLRHWQMAAALVLLLGIIRLAWPNIESGQEDDA